MTNINQTGVWAPFTFAGTGDHLYVRGSITNIGSVTTAVVTSGQAGNIISIGGQVASFGAGDAIRMTGGGTIINNGLIAGAITSDAAVSLTNAGRFVGFFASTQSGPGAGSRIINKSSMMLAESVGASAHVAGALISLGGADDIVVNRGRMMGDIWLGEGNNIFDNRGGDLMGLVHGGSGNDSYMFDTQVIIDDTGGIDTIIARSSFVLANGFENLTLGGFGNFTGTGNTAGNSLTGNAGSNLLSGLGGNDTLAGGGGADTLDGGTNNDSLQGQNGADRMTGGYGNDTMSGGDGSDVLTGDTGSDLMAGDIGADTLYGGIGADTMAGGDGADLLTGGAFGTDSMTGGLGADTFIYVSANDSFATLAADVITDFEVGIDKIDLSALVAGDLLFMASDPFSLTDASVRVAGSGGNTLVSIDLDFNGTADMQIVLTGVVALTAGDFAL